MAADEKWKVEYMLGLFVVVGVLGNGVAMCVFARKKEKLPHTIFILTLAITDFLTCSVVIPMAIFFIHSNYLTDSDLLCKLYHFFITSNVPFSAFIMVAISVERYISVCHPFLHLMNSKNTMIIIFVLLLFACSLGTITCLAYGTYEDCNKIGTGNATNDSLASNDIMFEQVTIMDRNSTRLNLIYDQEIIYCNSGKCGITKIFLSHNFLLNYQKVYASLYLISFLSTLILYGLIYRYVFWRRAKRWKVQLKQRQMLNKNGSTVLTDTCHTENTTEMVSIQNVAASASSNTDNCTAVKNHTDAENRETEIILKKGTKPKNFQKKITMKDKNRFANFKLAVMLFVVNLVFICAFLPSWLMAIQAIQFSAIVFYAYFCYNVANPLIYAFMNPSFREDLWALLCFFRQGRSDRQYL